MNRKKQILEAVSKHILKEYHELNEQQFDLQQKIEAEMAAREAQQANPNAPGGVGPPEPTADEKVKAMLDRFRGDRASFQKAQQNAIEGKTKIPNFPASMLKVGENMSQLSMKQGEASKTLAGLPPPMMKGGKGGASGLPNAATYGVPGAEVVYNPNRINSPTALMALRNNAAKAAARLKAQEAGAASAPPPASNTGAGSSTAPPASGQGPSTASPPKI